jgi:drug/metabolite transporter (DMT)-like permease
LPAESLQRWALVLAWLTPGLWSVNAIVSRLAPGVIEPYTLAMGRWAIAGTVLALWARADLRQHGGEWRQRPWAFLLLGFLGMFVCGALFYKAGRTTQAINMGLIYATSPILITLASTYGLGERRLSRGQWLGVGLALWGVMHVVTGGQYTRMGDIVWVEGDLWMMVCALAWAAYALLLRQVPSALGDMGRLALINFAGVLCLSPFVLAEWLDPTTPPWSIQALGLVVAAAIIPGIGSYLIYGWAQRVLGAARVSVTLYLGPLWNAVMAWLLLGEQLGPHHWMGALLILPGIYLATRKAA